MKDIVDLNKINKPKKSINKKKIAIAVSVGIILLIVAITMLLYYSSKDVREFLDEYLFRKNVTQEKLNSINLDYDSNISIFAYNKNICVLAENKLTQYNSSGKVDCETNLEINNPIYNVNNKYIAISEKNGTEINLISGSDILWTKKVDGNVSQLDVNSNGYVSAILTGTTYKSVIITFDKDGNELFKIYRSSTKVVDTNISNDNKHLAFAEVNTSGTTIESVIKIISIEKAKVSSDDFIESTYTADSNKLILGIRFQGNNSLVCMYDEEISILENGNNTVILSLNEKGKNINFANINLENCIYRSIEQNEGLFNTNTVVEIKNITNNKITVHSIEGAAKYIYSYNNIIAVDLGQEIEFINTSGWLLKSYSSGQEVQDVVIGNGIAGIVYKDKLEFLNL